MDAEITNLTALGLLATVILGVGRWLGAVGLRLISRVEIFIDRVAAAQEAQTKQQQEYQAEAVRRGKEQREHVEQTALALRHDLAQVEKNLSAQILDTRRDLILSLRGNGIPTRESP